MPRLSLIAKFSISSLLLLAGISVLLGVGLTRQFEQQAVEQQKLALSSLLPPVVGPYLTPDLLADGAHGQGYQSIDQALSYLGGLGLVHAKLWDKQGRIIYADDASLVGQQMPPGLELVQALAGTSAAEIVPTNTSGSDEDRGYGELLRVYTPLQLPGTTDVAVAFEGYFDAADLQERIDYVKGFLWTGVTFGFLFVYTSLFFIVYNASRKVTRQSEENAELYKEAQNRLEERNKAEKQTQRQVERLAALRIIDTTITSSLDLRVTLNVILDQVCTQLRVHAASILLLDPGSAVMTFSGGRGFRSNAIIQSYVRWGEGFPGSAVSERRTFGIASFAEIGDPRRVAQLANEEFVSYCVVPLIAKGQVKGVLEVFHRTPLEVNQEWVGFLEALAGQTAIAVDNATLFNDLQQSNLNLALAYDMTLEGWSRALDLRDKETEGHTQRVTEMTVKLGRFIGVSDAELLQMRRGALLHDIGKMGIPDSILLKPGPLTDAEWEIMRCHPVYAFELLSPIPYLKGALDIPYCHHEKWDGSGYPNKLKGEQIPFPARIFAIVDVWDALSSDRPYRKALPRDQVYAHLAAQSGHHFDPRIVQAFFKMEIPTFSQLCPQHSPLTNSGPLLARDLTGTLSLRVPQ
ncbi:MAG: GAF domain-containing protein [Chloroflexi bacterium]|nr:GAF domain-containing protein [Chloroflexota bacterium]